MITDSITQKKGSYTSFLVVGIGETLFHIPTFSALNAFGFTHIGLQIGVLIAGTIIFVLLTAISLHWSIKNFEKIDL